MKTSAHILFTQKISKIGSLTFSRSQNWEKAWAYFQKKKEKKNRIEKLKIRISESNTYDIQLHISYI